MDFRGHETGLNSFRKIQALPRLIRVLKGSRLQGHQISGLIRHRLHVRFDTLIREDGDDTCSDGTGGTHFAVKEAGPLFHAISSKIAQDAGVC
ncbi:MAG TPA: hypothetical protein PK760_15440 [Flavobacteriales bacterium]|nr:hypothetical protein [Flavobacteriales bacterium]